MMIQIIAAVIATVGFSILFGVPSKYYPYCGVIGGAGWLVYLLTLEHFSTAGASLAATMVVIFLSRLAAVRKKCPVTIFLIAGIFPLVPGAGVYWTAYYIVTDQLRLAAETGYTAVRWRWLSCWELCLYLKLPAGVICQAGRK